MKNKHETTNSTKHILSEVAVKKRRNIQYCKFWKPRGKKTHYCSIDENDPLKQCYGVCKKYDYETDTKNKRNSCQ